MQRLLFQNVDFREEPRKDAIFVSLNHVIRNEHARQELHRYLTGGYKIEVRARCANFRPLSFQVQTCEAEIYLTNWACNTREYVGDSSAPDGHVTVSATYPGKSFPYPISNLI